MYRTDLNGDVTMTTDGTTYDVKTGQASSQPIAVIAKTVTTQQAVSSQSATGAVCDCSYNRYNCKDFQGHDAAQTCQHRSQRNGIINRPDCHIKHPSRGEDSRNNQQYSKLDQVFGLPLISKNKTLLVEKLGSSTLIKNVSG